MTAPTTIDGAMMNEHDIALTVNRLRDIAKEYGQTQQLRERIAAVVVPLLSANKPAAPTDDYVERLELSKALCRIINNTGMAVWQVEAIERAAKMLSVPVAAPAESGEWDAYRLKVAEDCNEQLMSACSDTGCPDGVNMADWIRGLGMLAPSCVAPAPDKRLPSREEIQTLRDHGHGEEAAYWEEALRKAAPQPSLPAKAGEYREKCAGCVKRCTNNPPDCYASAVVLDDERTEDNKRAEDAAVQAYDERLANNTPRDRRAFRDGFRAARAASPQAAQPATINPNLDKAERDISTAQLATATQPAQTADVSSIVDAWIRSRGTWMDGAGYTAAVQLATYVSERILQPAQTDRAQVLVDLLSNDAYAMSFQSMGQYRAALLTAAQPASGGDHE